MRDRYGNVVESPLHQCYNDTSGGYFVIARKVIEEMPFEWQKKFAALLEEANSHFDGVFSGLRYAVYVRNSKGRYANDHLALSPILGLRSAHGRECTCGLSPGRKLIAAISNQLIGKG